MTNLIAAMIMVESSGNNLARGDGGRSLGPLQITRDAVRDVNRVYGTQYRWKQMTNRVTAVDVCIKYVRIYRKNPTPEEFVRIHNGGPSGPSKQSTIAHWNKVKKEMK
jgi:hypothetical protein